MQQEYPLSEYRVTCDQAECENFGISILVLADASTPDVVCGPCGLQITNVLAE